MIAAPPIDPAWAAEDKGPAVIAFLCVFTPLATLFCAMRLYTRGYILGKLHLDDYFIAMSVFCGLLSMGFNIKAVLSGNGKHFIVLSDDRKGDALLWSIIAFSPSVLSFALPKLGVVALLVRLLNPGRAQRIFLWTLAIVCTITLSLCNVLIFTQCKPARSLWDITITNKKCWDPSILVNYSIYAGSLSAFTDLYLALYPAVVLFGLQMKLKKKLALSAALGIGSVATVVSIYKITRIPLLASPDFTYETCDLAIWTCIEADTLIIAACIPVLQPLYERVFGTRAFGGSSERRNYKRYGASGDSDKRQYADLELSGMSGSRRRGPRDPNGLTFLDQGNEGSEENITWTQHDLEKVGPSATESTTTTELSPVKESRGQSSKIVRTRIVSVEYGDKKGTAKEREEEKRWKLGF